MKSSYGLVRDWVIKKMNLDEQIFKRVDKQMLNQPMHENVRLILVIKKFKNVREINILVLDEQYYFRKNAYVKTQNNMDTLLKGSHRSYRLFYLTFFSEYFLSC